MKKYSIFATVFSFIIRTLPLLFLIVLVGAISFSCDPVKRIEKLKDKICPLCPQVTTSTDSIISFVHDSTYWGDTIYSVGQEVIAGDTITIESVKYKVLYKDRTFTTTKLMTQHVPIYVPGATKYKIPNIFWVTFIGFWIIIIIFVLWMLTKIGNITNLFKKS